MEMRFFRSLSRSLDRYLCHFCNEKCHTATHFKWNVQPFLCMWSLNSHMYRFVYGISLVLYLYGPSAENECKQKIALIGFWPLSKVWLMLYVDRWHKSCQWPIRICWVGLMRCCIFCALTFRFIELYFEKPKLNWIYEKFSLWKNQMLGNQMQNRMTHAYYDL